jgi:hypothetical protein
MWSKERLCKEKKDLVGYLIVNPAELDIDPRGTQPVTSPNLHLPLAQAQARTDILIACGERRVRCGVINIICPIKFDSTDTDERNVVPEPTSGNPYQRM